MHYATVSFMKKLAAAVAAAPTAAIDEQTAVPAEPRVHPLWQVFAITSLGTFVVSLDLSIVNVAFPAMAQAFPDATRSQLAWVITAYSIVFGSLLVVGGRSGDRNGLRRVFFAGLA